MISLRPVLLLLCGLAVGGCKQDPPAAVPPTASRPAVTPASRPASAPAALDPGAEADALYTSRCVTCHGRDGLGDGPASGALNPKPRSFADPEWQASVTDEAIEKIVLLGGPAVGKSPLMPPNADLEGKPAVIAALRAKVRGFARK